MTIVAVARKSLPVSNNKLPIILSIVPITISY